MIPILACDIGGTNCRLALFYAQAGGLSLVRTAQAATAGMENIAGLAGAIREQLDFEPQDAAVLVAALAGLVEDRQRCRLTHASFALDLADCATVLPNLKICLINDFVAQAWSLLEKPGQNAEVVIAGTGISEYARDYGTRAVIGAGTGMGYSALYYDRPFWNAQASEFGNAPFPMLNAAEQEFQKFLCARFEYPHATSDAVLSGRGLSALHHFLSGRDLSPAQVADEALEHETETLAWYSRFYARACRAWMLSTLCSGGLWLAGGIAAKNPLTVKSAHFRQEICASPKWDNFLRAIPVRLIMDTQSGLWGAARYGFNQLVQK